MTLYYLFLAAGFVFSTWLLAKQVQLTWVQWLLGVLGWLLGALALQNWAASLLEAEPRAAGFLLMIFGIPALILLALAWFLPTFGKKKA